MTEETKTAAKEAAAEAATEEVKAEAQETETEAKPDKASKLKSENKALTAENEKLKKELAETSDKYLRMLAEYDNFRRRTQKEKQLLPLILHEQKKKQERRIPIYVQKDKEKAYENHRSPSLCGYRKGYQGIQENY